MQFAIDADFNFYELYKNNEPFDYITDNAYTDYDISIGAFQYYLVAYDENGNYSGSSDSVILTIGNQQGDINMDGSVNIIDVIALVNFILEGGDNDMSQTDINGNGSVDIVDIIALVNIILDNQGTITSIKT